MPIERYADYDCLAGVYNAHLSGFGERLLPVLERLVLPAIPAEARILDLCCGTGQLARALCRRGYRVTGVDGSEEMLRLARQNAPAAEWLLADARDFRLPCCFDAALSTFDSLNHVLSVDELSAVFRNVLAALYSRGLFAFDLNMEPAFATRWNGCFRAVAGGQACEIRAQWDPQARLGRNRATLCRLADGRPIAEATFVERCYSETEVVSALRQAGFAAVSTYDLQCDLGMNGDFGRYLFVARKC